LSRENTGDRRSKYCGCLVVEGKDLLVIRVRLNNNDQLWHLYQALRGHCEVEMVPDSEGPVLEIPSASGSSSASVLRRLDGWLSEFGVESISIELDGRPYVMSKGAGDASSRALAGVR
jgi:hypothetical protein